MSDMTTADMVRNYIKLRDHKEKAERDLKKSLERVTEGMAKLEGMMLDHLNQSGGTSLTCKGIGTVYIKTRESASVKDREAFLSFIMENDLWGLLDARANKPNVKKMFDEGTVVPGVNLSSMKTVGVRRGD